ncbi:hypothetical protein BaRGS_00017932 [Batillaria attramentaria]|uniref:Uncharacterized protein n=1 Tax=Batillaria attramentaria TaxID=370345 RepID=A0ABD0KUW3_9CAEN
MHGGKGRLDDRAGTASGLCSSCRALPAEATFFVEIHQDDNTIQLPSSLAAWQQVSSTWAHVRFNTETSQLRWPCPSSHYTPPLPKPQPNLSINEPAELEKKKNPSALHSFVIIDPNYCRLPAKLFPASNAFR